jgi:hypothetical protein
MKRRLTLDVKDAAEFEAIARALEDLEIRTFVLIVGTLLPFTPRERQRMMTFVADKLDETAGTVRLETRP